MLKIRTAGSFCAMILGIAGASSLAHANLLLNGGLETTLSPASNGVLSVSNTVSSNALQGWTILGPIDVVASKYWHPFDGTYSVDLIGTPGLGGISQTVNNLVAGNSYELTFEMAINPDSATGEVNDTKRLQVSLTDASFVSEIQPSFPGAAAITPFFVNSGSANITAALSGANAVFSGVVKSTNKSTLPYILETVDFVAPSSSVTLSLTALTPLGLPANFNLDKLYCGPVIDNVSLTPISITPTPEPAALGILSVGGILLARRRRH